jgi:CubicO group peptidase (beta-lactamase class C family)
MAVVAGFINMLTWQFLRYQLGCDDALAPRGTPMMRYRTTRVLRSVTRLTQLLVWPVVLAVFASTTSVAQESKLPDRFAGFDNWVESLMDEWKVPGVALAAIQDGKVVIAKGYGYGNLENKLPVTKDTLFAIGSNSKSFTATLLGMLSDDGLLKWDRPVRQYLPDFRLRDAVASEQMTARDLVTHRSGLPRHDLAWFATGRSRRELFDRLQYLEPTQPFRARFQYQNLMFMTAGYLAGQMTDSSWETQVSARIMKPLGMQRSNFSVDAMQRDADFSQPYSLDEDKVVRIPFRNIDAVGPAGSINSSVAEMMPYIQFHIDLGLHGQNRLLSENNARQMQLPQMAMAGPIARRVGEGNEVGDPSYGLGLMVTTYRGHKLVQHGGGIDGFISGMAWLPHDRIGVMVLSNFSGAANPVPEIVIKDVFDRLLELDPIDWNARSRKRIEEQQAKEKSARAKATAERKEGPSLSHDLADYEGTYKHPGYGTAQVRVEGSSLRCAVVGFDLPLTHFHYDVFVVPREIPRELRQFAGRRMQFFYDKNGRVDRLAIPLEASADDIEFTSDKPQSDENQTDQEAEKDQ